MYEEFCQGVGMKVDPKCYERIEAVYMAFDRFNSKEDVYAFYRAHDMNGIETLYAELHEYNKLNARRKLLEGELKGIIGQMNRATMLCGIRAA